MCSNRKQASHFANKHLTFLNCSFQILMIVLITILNYKLFFAYKNMRKNVACTGDGTVIVPRVKRSSFH